MLFGNYYAFDNPSSLNRQLREFLGSSPENFQFELNLLYSVYSIPNVVLPLILGAILDRFGHRQMINLLSAFVVVGQVIFTIGAMVKNFPVMLIGRVFFGIGGESLGVAQTKLMTDWFRGKELAFAMGLTVSVGTVGTVANNLLSPYFASAVSVPFALWVGTFLCILSFFSSVWTTFIDKKYRAHLLNISMGINFLTEEHELTAPLTDTSEKADEPLLQKPRKGNNFHPAFWLLTLITFLLYGVSAPFNNVASDFLQTKYPDLDPLDAGRLMSIPDTFCIIFIPLLGYFLDHVGYRAIAFTIGSLIMSISHFLFALSHLPPYIILLQIGLSNATLLGIWPCVPILISENRLSTGYGIVTASSNLSFMIVPIIVAYLVVDDPTYTNNELFFACATVVAFVLSTILIFWGWKESLELNAAEISPTKEKGKNSPPVSPKPSTTLAPLNDGLKSEKDNSFGRLDHSTLNFGLFDEKDKQRTSETLRDENGNSLESLMDTYDQSVVFRGSRSKHKFAK